MTTIRVAVITKAVEEVDTRVTTTRVTMPRGDTRRVDTVDVVALVVDT
jgi:hypothetical protein